MRAQVTQRDSRSFSITTGVGINVDNEGQFACLNGLLGPGRHITREALLAAFLNEFESMFAQHCRNGFGPFVDECVHRSLLCTA